MQRVVGRARQRHRAFRVEILGGGIVLGQNLQIDAGFIHLANAERAKIVELALERRVLLAAQFPQPRRREMLFESDDFRLRHWRGFSVPIVARKTTAFDAPDKRRLVVAATEYYTKSQSIEGPWNRC